MTLKEVARELCASVAVKKITPSEVKPRPAHDSSCKRKKKISRWRITTLDVEGDAGRFSCEILCEKAKKKTKARRMGKCKDKWNSGCDWPKAVAGVWQDGQL